MAAIAIEAAEGSNAMIARSEMLLTPRRCCRFIKMAKISQDLRLDMPVFGNDTIRLAGRARLSFLAIEADPCYLQMIWHQSKQLLAQASRLLALKAKPNHDRAYFYYGRRTIW